MSRLSMADVRALSVLLQAADETATVVFIAPGDESGKIRRGTARHIVRSTDNWYFPGGDYDVRDCALRITETSGLDVAYPVRDLMQVVDMGEFMIEQPAVTR